MALRERAPLAVLARQANRKALVQKRAEGERLGGGPVDPLANLDCRAAVFEKASNGFMNVEAFRRRCDALAERLQSIETDASLTAAIVVSNLPRRLDARPAAVEPIGLVGGIGLDGLEFRLQPSPPV